MISAFLLAFLILQAGRPSITNGNKIAAVILSEVINENVSELPKYASSAVVTESSLRSANERIEILPVSKNERRQNESNDQVITENTFLRTSIPTGHPEENSRDEASSLPTLPTDAHQGVIRRNIRDENVTDKSMEENIIIKTDFRRNSGNFLLDTGSEQNVGLLFSHGNTELQKRMYVLPFYQKEKGMLETTVKNVNQVSGADVKTTVISPRLPENRTQSKSTVEYNPYQTESPHLVMTTTVKNKLLDTNSKKIRADSENIRRDQDDDASNSVELNRRLNESQYDLKASGENVIKRWKQLERDIKFRTDSLLKKALPKILAYKSHINVSSTCATSVMQLVTGLRNLKSWAVRMVDASGRFPSGSLAGTFTDLGDYDQCLEISYSQRKNRPKTRGQYCTLEMKPLIPSLDDEVSLYGHGLNFGNASKDSILFDLSHDSVLFHIMVLRIGVCVPSHCSEHDIRELATIALRKIPIEITVRNCETKSPVHLSTAQVIISSVAVVIILLIGAGTILNHCSSKTAIKPQQMGRVRLSLEAFSAVKNLRQLMKKSGRSSTLASVNGIRCLSLMWIILAHTYGFGHRQGLARLSKARYYLDDILFQIISNAWVSVDTFFMLGGLLVAMPNLKSFEETNGKMNFTHYVAHRIWRLTPPVAATVGIMFLLPLVGSGPLWNDMVGQKVANCEKNWWQAILPLNTWINFDVMCLLHTWYVAADIHFYCIAPVALLLLFNWPVVGLLVLTFMTVSCSIVSGLLTYLYSLPPTVIFFSPDLKLTRKTANLLYFRPYPHMGAYCVGIALGFVLWKYRKVVLNWPLQITGWCLSIISCLAVLFATYPWSRNQMPSTATCIAYAMMHRTAWAAGVAWVIFICATGRGGLLNQFLSWQFFVPLSRLSYSIYLLHFPVLWVRTSWRRTLVNFHHYDMVSEFCGILVVTLALSILFHIAFEAPFLKLEEIWYPRKKQIPKLKPEGVAVK